MTSDFDFDFDEFADREITIKKLQYMKFDCKHFCDCGRGYDNTCRGYSTYEWYMIVKACPECIEDFDGRIVP